MTGSLYSYCMPWDSGSAPNPYWGTCTLAICKPGIRRTAQVGDWVVGTGSRNARGPDGNPGRDLVGRLVYAMRVSGKLTMPEYDWYTRAELPGKVPDAMNDDPRRRVGDSIYDFSVEPNPRLRSGSAHEHGDQERDLAGGYVLLSDHFYYFGENAVELPEQLLPILKQGQGHKSYANRSYVAQFVDWIEGFELDATVPHGRPLMQSSDRIEIAEPCRSVKSCQVHGRTDHGAGRSVISRATGSCSREHR